MATNDFLEQLRPWIAKHERVAWLPKTAAGDGVPHTSKFSGSPLLLKGEDWPKCKGCRKPLELLVQLNLSELPDPNLDFGKGFLQLFYCTGDTYCDGGWEPFADQSSLCRIVQGAESKPATENLNRFSGKCIVGWEPISDRPHSEEFSKLGVDFDFHFSDVPFHPAEMWCRELGLHFVGIDFINQLCDEVIPSERDKLGGWPFWVQGPEYPRCPKCKSEMTYVMQIASEDNVPYMFGDCGIGHITQCRQHKDIVAFGWACS